MSTRSVRRLVKSIQLDFPTPQPDNTDCDNDEEPPPPCFTIANAYQLLSATIECEEDIEGLNDGSGAEIGDQFDIVVEVHARPRVPAPMRDGQSHANPKPSAHLDDKPSAQPDGDASAQPQHEAMAESQPELPAHEVPEVLLQATTEAHCQPKCETISQLEQEDLNAEVQTEPKAEVLALPEAVVNIEVAGPSVLYDPQPGLQDEMAPKISRKSKRRANRRLRKALEAETAKVTEQAAEWSRAMTAKAARAMEAVRVLEDAQALKALMEPMPVVAPMPLDVARPLETPEVEDAEGIDPAQEIDFAEAIDAAEAINADLIYGDEAEPVASTSRDDEIDIDLPEYVSDDSQGIPTPEEYSSDPDSGSFCDYHLNGNDHPVRLSDIFSEDELETMGPIRIIQAKRTRLGSAGSTMFGRMGFPTPSVMSSVSLDVNEIFEATQAMGDALLTVKLNVVRVNADMRRRFGTEDPIEKTRKPTIRERLLRRATLIEFPEELLYPHHHGLSMTMQREPDGHQYYTFDHSPHHQRMHHNYLELRDRGINAIETLNYALRNSHIEALLEMFDTMCRSDDLPGAHTLIQHIVAILQYASAPSFNIADRTTCLPYEYMENRPYFIAILKYIYMLSNKACHRTALEMCKMLINLDPTDPVGVLFIIDTVAIRAREFFWLVDMLEFWAKDRCAHFLFNMLFSHALAFFHCIRRSDDQDDQNFANDLLQHAIIRYPYVVTAIISNLPVPEAREVGAMDLYAVTAHTNNGSLTALMDIYARLTWPRWNEPGVRAWFLYNARLIATLHREDRDVQKSVHQFSLVRPFMFGTMPPEIHRHLCILQPLANLILDGMNVPAEAGFTPFDPVPPVNTIDRYGYRNRRPLTTPPRPRNWYAFFTSMLPFRDPGA